jgi:hypothetical protein
MIPSTTPTGSKLSSTLTLIYLFSDVYQSKGKVRKIRATERTTLQPFRAAARPVWPSAPAMTMAGMMEIVRVMRRRRKGDMRQFMAPSQII